MDAIVLLREYAQAGGWGCIVHELEPGHPAIQITWPGSDSSLPSLLLNSHMDVVPVDAEHWSKDPWGGTLAEGKVWGRGAQDMKCVGSQYMEALLRLRASGWAPTRDIHVLYVPDEEVGGLRGMKLLLANDILTPLNVGVALDEGLASPDERYSVFWGERKIYWLRVRATGAAGHGSRFIEGTAVEALMRVVSRVLAFREAQRSALEAAEACACGKTLGDFTSVNCTMLAAGERDRLQYNVIPTLAQAGFDVRIPCSVDLAAFQAKIAGWCDEPGVTWELVNGTADDALRHAASRPEGHYWDLFQRGLTAAGAVTHAPSVFPAATDSRWIRMALGVPCFGFSPMRNTPILLHDHDEHLSVKTFCEGIRVYEALIREMASSV